jgi:hypothetical protein
MTLMMTGNGQVGTKVETSETYSVTLDWEDIPSKDKGKTHGRTYPIPPNVGGVTEVIHGVKIEDPWRELETLESEETQRFIRQQNEVS